MPNDAGGYQYVTRGHVLGSSVMMLLDTGAAVNSVTEELVVGMINKALNMGIRADHEATHELFR